jgi:hypothetical protein
MIFSRTIRQAVWFRFSVFSSQVLVVGFPGMVLGSEYFVTKFSVGNLGFCFTDHKLLKSKHWKEKSPRKPDRSGCRGPKLK